ncbi:hypothetical protein ASZ78_014546 [Callipepla squamata]|uniref:U-box domain-containing protein n=1 Tax=Callipepla squamata TaxID=9009 RepID=A0A226MJM7_CALSU|nr:hypothetical protein ASZ78_008060 [Callipepla squamata]OXB55418.1 hypothetical protein ASZ78_014546 [Callipepla squamata]
MLGCSPETHVYRQEKVNTGSDGSGLPYGQDWYVTTCAFAPHGLLLATGSMDKTVHIWQLDSKQPCAESLGLRSKILQKIEELRVKTVSVSVPDEFLCPITRELMKDPVIAADGYSYEKEAMENWLSSKRRSSPMTNLPLSSPVLTPNRTLKMAISRWLEAHSSV